MVTCKTKQMGCRGRLPSRGWGLRRAGKGVGGTAPASPWPRVVWPQEEQEPVDQGLRGWLGKRK